MAPPSGRALLGLAVLGCLAWAGVEARHLGDARRWGDPCAARPPDAAAVEASYAPLRAALDQGRSEAALLHLRERTARGPYPGYAWFLLGEVAYREGAAAAAVGHYRRAVEVDPSVADRGSALNAAGTIGRRLAALREGPWGQDPPAEIRDLYALQRRLAGGCE